MATVAEIYDQGLKKGDLGIEIETETARAYDVPVIRGWHHKPDGSLRNFGIEYISRGPVAIDKVTEHLHDWLSGLGPIHKKLDPNSVSTSVHVHVNVQSMEPLQVLNFYLCGILFEGVLSHYAGVDREGNLFCLRTSDAEAHFSRVKKSIQNARTERDLVLSLNPEGAPKLYCNIHTVPVSSLGTIEFRCMRGTTNTTEIRSWCQALYNIREFSKKFNDPSEILRYVRDNGVEATMREVFGDLFLEFMYEGAFKNILQHVYYVADIASCRKDWKFKPATIKPKKAPVRVGVAEDGNVIDWDEDVEVGDM